MSSPDFKPSPSTHYITIADRPVGYAVTYPFGIVGIILAMVMVRAISRIDPAEEAKAFALEQDSGSEPVQRMCIRVRNPNMTGLRLHEIPSKDSLGIIISRIKYVGETEVGAANADTVLHEGDTVLAVGTLTNLHKLCLIMGTESTEDLMETPGPVTFDRFVVTSSLSALTIAERREDEARGENRARFAVDANISRSPSAESDIPSG